ncbi:hypothetical protein AB6A40_004385 [Gnathostoma spinigerum]|uniref:Uncharacterized protein n=1 Tax=Gnathostoma spinigerum TaxID=75299 RepID=A0ABD6EDE5_9BILA
MGQTVSRFPARPAYYPIFSITFRRRDRVTVVDADPEVIHAIRNVLATYYSDGIQRERRLPGGSTEFQLRGFPFVQGFKNSATMFKLVLCRLFVVLRNSGWRLCISSDLSRLSDLSTLFFQKVSCETYSGCQVFCLSLSSTDKFKLINAPPQAHQLLIDIVGSLLQSSSVENMYSEVQLRGYAWLTTSSIFGCEVRKILLDIFRRFHSIGYRYYGTANLKNTADCIFFISDESSVGLRHYAMLSLNATDRIRLIDTSPEIIEVVRRCLEQNWSQGIQNEGPKDDGSYYEFKLNGRPWLSCGNEAIDSRLILTLIFQQLAGIGWDVVTALDISRRPNDKAVFVLRRCAATNIPHFAISMNSTDIIRVIYSNREVNDFIAATLSECWTLGVSSFGRRNGCSEFILNGTPWSCSSTTSQFEVTRMLMSRIMYVLALRGWKVVFSADVSAKYERPKNREPYPVDVHSWFVAYTGYEEGQRTALSSLHLSEVQHIHPSAPPIDIEEVMNTPPSYANAVKQSNRGCNIRWNIGRAFV